jgi:hypothetical protein
MIVLHTPVMFCALTWTDWSQREEKKMHVRPCMDEQVQHAQVLHAQVLHAQDDFRQRETP